MAQYSSVLSDPLLMRCLSWRDIEDAYLLELDPEPRRSLAARGLLNVARLDSPEFERMFRFKKVD